MRRIFEAQPEEEGGEEGDEPAVAVLLVRRPLQAQVAAENEPEQPERGEKQDQPGSQERLRARRGGDSATAEFKGAKDSRGAVIC